MSTLEDYDMKSEPDSHRQWYVLKTKPRIERQVASILESREIIVYLPLLNRRRILESLFPSYLFLRIDCSTNEYMRSRSAPCVGYILSADGVPVPIMDVLVDEIRRRGDKENGLSPAARFAPMDHVVITSGPFRGVEGIFDRALTPQGRCLVLLQILGRLTRVQVDAAHLDRGARGYSFDGYTNGIAEQTLRRKGSRS